MGYEPKPRTGTGDRDEPLHVLRQKHAINTLSFDTVFDLLSNRRRRFAIHHLMGLDDGTADVDEIAERIAAWERELIDAESDSDPDDSHERRVLMTLTEIHLPKLADTNVIDYDVRSGFVRYWGHPVVEEYAEHVASAELP